MDTRLGVEGLYGPGACTHLKTCLGIVMAGLTTAVYTSWALAKVAPHVEMVAWARAKIRLVIFSCISLT